MTAETARRALYRASDECDECGERYWPRQHGQRFCSADCSVAWHNRERPPMRVPKGAQLVLPEAQSKATEGWAAALGELLDGWPVDVEIDIEMAREELEKRHVIPERQWGLTWGGMIGRRGFTRVGGKRAERPEANGRRIGRYMKKRRG